MSSAKNLLTAMLVLTFFSGSGLIGAMAQEDKDPHATGCRRPTEAERAEADKVAVKTGKVRLNAIGLGRVNAARQGRGLKALRGAEVDLAPVGQEVAPAAEPSGSGEAAPAALPNYVDNSTLKYFPPIRSQGSLGSCAQFSSMYYTMTHMTAMARDWDAKAGGDSYRFSPKWTYNMLNGGVNQGTWHYDAYNIAISHGVARWSEFPYDSNYTAWCLDPAVWRNAINVRADQWGRVTGLDTQSGLDQLKQLLVDGYILNFATYVNSWQFKTVGNDPATTADDAFVGKSCAYWVNGSNGGHAMTIVGYSDDIWVDINGNGSVDSGEKGAFRIANSWGTGYQEGGFTWFAYDGIRATSAVNGGPSANRREGWWYREACWLTARAAYTPKVVAEFTVNHAKRNQLRMRLGIGDTSATTPSTSWYPRVISNQGGAYGFSGTTAVVDGTFVFDFTDILPAAGQNKRWFLGAYDSTSGDAATVKAYKLINVSNGGALVCSQAPRTADAGEALLYVDYAYQEVANTPPTIADIANQTTDEDTATATVPFAVGDAETSADSLVLTAASSNTALVPTAGIVLGGSGANRTVRVTPAANQSGSAAVTVTVTDYGGRSASDSFVVTVNPVNDAPVADAQSVVTQPGLARAITLTGSDVEGSPLSYIVSLPTHGSLSGTAPTLTYTPAAGYEGLDSFTFKVNDGQLDSAPATVSVNVTSAPIPGLVLLSARDQFGVDVPGAQVEVSSNAGTVLGTYDAGTKVQFAVGTSYKLKGKLQGVTGPSTTVVVTESMFEIVTGFWKTTVRCRDQYGTDVAGAQVRINVQYTSTVVGVYDPGDVLTLPRGSTVDVFTLLAGCTGARVQPKLDTGVEELVGPFWSATIRCRDQSGTDVPGSQAKLNVAYTSNVIGVYNPGDMVTLPRGCTVDVFGVLGELTGARTQPKLDTGMDEVAAQFWKSTCVAKDADGNPVPGATIKLMKPYTSTVIGIYPAGTVLTWPNGFSVWAYMVVGTVTGDRLAVTLQSPLTEVSPPAPTVVIAPAIVTQPADATVEAGQAASFSVVASGTAPLSYQWRRNGANISGATSASYTTPATALGDSGALFSVAVSNSAGSVTSSSAVLTVVSVNHAPTISMYSPATPFAMLTGAAQVFSVDAWDADGDALAYAWKLDGATVPLTGDSFTYSPSAADAGGHSIEVTVSDGKGGSVKQAWSVTVTVPVVPPSIATQPADATVIAGQTATFSVVAAGTAPLSYQWYKNGVAVSGATSASYATPATTLADSGAKFKVTVANSGGSVTSNEATLTVNPDPNQFEAPTGLAALVDGSTVTLTWTDNSACEDGFYVERGVTAKGKTTWVRAGQAAAGGVVFSETVANGTYKYRVQAFSAARGVTGYSNEVQAKVGGGKPPRK